MAGPDGADPFSRNRPLGEISAFPEKLRLGIPRKGQLIFFGDVASEKAYGEAMERWKSLGATLVEFDLEPFYETARLLYEGPWVAERYLVIRNLLASSPESIHPVTREITAAGARLTAADTFSSLYRLQGLRRIAERAFANLDAIVLPTAPTAYSTAQVLANPIELNSRLGTYTNFVNLLDLCGLALPASMRADGIPFGITLLAPAGRDAELASIGRAFHADTKLKMGAKGLTQPPLVAPSSKLNGDEIAIAVVGAHLSGMALNGELQALNGRLLEATATAPDYKLYALDTTPPKPGMLRIDPGKGTAIKLELWALSAAAFGKFVAAIPTPMAIGTIKLADGRDVKGLWSTIIARAIDQFVHVPSGVRAMKLPSVLRKRPPSPSCSSGVGNRHKSTSAPSHLFSLQGPVATSRGGTSGRPRASTSASTMSRADVAGGSPRASATRAR